VITRIYSLYLLVIFASISLPMSNQQSKSFQKQSQKTQKSSKAPHSSSQKGEKTKKNSPGKAVQSHASNLAYLKTRSGQFMKAGFFNLIAKLSLTMGSPDLKKEIPYRLPFFMKGTQVPTMRLYFTDTDIVLVTATAYTTVFSAMASNLLNFSSFQAIFDEFRPITGELEYLPNAGAVVVTPNLGIAVIDYVTNGALANTTAGQAYDAKQWFHPTVTPASPKVGKVVWRLLFEPLPDQEWLTTAAPGSTTPFAYWKPFIQAPGLGQTSGKLTGWMDIQFRNSF
jgi:hypothetical protein